MIDSGASVNILDDVIYNQITRNKGIRLEKTNHKIYFYGSLRPLPVKGTITTNISTDSKHLSTQFHLVDGNSRNLLNCTTACQLDLLKVTVNNTTYHSPSTTQYPHNSNVSYLESESSEAEPLSYRLILMFLLNNNPTVEIRSMFYLMLRKSSNGLKT